MKYVIARIQCALAMWRQPARVVRVTGYAGGYLHLELSAPIDLSPPGAYAAVMHAAGLEPEWSPGEAWLGFRAQPALEPLNPVEGRRRLFSWLPETETPG